jgi:hypothetical protein
VLGCVEGGSIEVFVGFRVAVLFRDPGATVGVLNRRGCAELCATLSPFAF